MQGLIRKPLNIDPCSSTRSVCVERTDMTTLKTDLEYAKTATIYLFAALCCWMLLVIISSCYQISPHKGAVDKPIIAMATIAICN